jgi:hypothetical protein
MDAELIVLSARSVERLIDVLLGGLAIYLGFRLFLLLPVETRGDGTIKLPGMSVVLVKAGPGLFFVAFGILVVIVSLYRPVTYGDDYSGFGPTTRQEPRRAPVEQTVSRPSTEDVVRAQLAVSALNCMNRLSTTGPRRLSVQDAEIATRDAKLALLSMVWTSEEWGDFDAFKEQTMRGAVSADNPVTHLFAAEAPHCPR